MRGSSLQPFFFALGLALVLAATGCASTGGGGGGSESPVYREDLGRVMVLPLERARVKIYGKYNINIFREESTNRDFTYESEWIPRAPTLEETAVGVTAAQNRVTLSGYRTTENLDGTYIYRTTFQVENQVQSTDGPDWHPAPMPTETRNEFRRIFSDLQMELRAGVIR